MTDTVEIRGFLAYGTIPLHLDNLDIAGGHVLLDRPPAIQRLRRDRYRRRVR